MLKDNYTREDISVLLNCVMASYMGAQIEGAIAIMPYPKVFPDGRETCDIDKLKYDSKDWLQTVVIQVSKDLSTLLESVEGRYIVEISVMGAVLQVCCAADSLSDIFATCGASIQTLNELRPLNERNAFIAEACAELKAAHTKKNEE